jgi:hypothetical protein
MTYQPGDRVLIVCDLYALSLNGHRDMIICSVGHAGVFTKRSYDYFERFIAFWAIVPYSETLSLLLE